MIAATNILDEILIWAREEVVAGEEMGFWPRLYIFFLVEEILASLIRTWVNGYGIRLGFKL